MRYFFIIILYFYVINIKAQETPSDNINYTKLFVIGGVTVGGFVIGYGLQNNMWWKGERSSFHFNWKNDWNYALGSDKIGHLYFGYLVSNIYKDAFIWSGIKERDAALYSGLFTFSYQTFLEIRDGFSNKYGFSWGDFSANFIGSFLMIMKTRYKNLEDYDLKISFYPSQKFKDGSNKYIIDDYESTYHWLSMNIKNLLPHRLQKYFPNFVNLAIGHNVNNIDFSNSSHELYLGFDWNLKYIISNNWLIKILKYINKFYRLPAPAIKIYPNVVWYGIRF